MRELTIAFSHSTADAFMFAALTQGALDTGGLPLRFHVADLETLNRRGLEGGFELTAASFHAYAYLAGKYRILGAGGIFGDRCGPLLVAREMFPPDALTKLQVASPGTLATASLALRLIEPDVALTLTPFDRILDAVAAGDVDAGLAVQEEQLTYAERGLEKLLDLGQWWHGETGLPLPLGGLFVRRDLGEALAGQLTALVRRSIEHALANEAEALAHALRSGRGVPAQIVQRFIRMYVNERAVAFGAEERTALAALLARAHERGLLPHLVPVDLVP